MVCGVWVGYSDQVWSFTVICHLATMSLMLNKLRTVARHPSKPEGKGTTRKPEGASASLDKPIFTKSDKQGSVPGGTKATSHY